MTRGAAAWFAAWRVLALHVAAFAVTGAAVDRSAGSALLGAIGGAWLGTLHGVALAIAVVYADRPSWRRACVRTTTGLCLVQALPLALALPVPAVAAYVVLLPLAVRTWAVPDDRGGSPDRPNQAGRPSDED